jgi:hypothetical protein
MSDQQWKNLRKIRNEKLAETDWIILKFLETDDNIPENYKQYRQALRDLPQNTENPYLPNFPYLWQFPIESSIIENINTTVEDTN